jgi:hypothetical protein
MIFVDAMDTGTPDDLRRVQPQPIEVSQRLLHGTKTVAIRDQRVHAPPSQGRSRAKQHGEHSTAGSRHQTAEGFTKVHVNRIPLM